MALLALSFPILGINVTTRQVQHWNKPKSLALLVRFAVRPCGAAPASKGSEHDTKSHDKTLLAFYLFVKIY